MAVWWQGCATLTKGWLPVEPSAGITTGLLCVQRFQRNKRRQNVAVVYQGAGQEVQHRVQTSGVLSLLRIEDSDKTKSNSALCYHHAPAILKNVNDKMLFPSKQTALGEHYWLIWHLCARVRGYEYKSLCPQGIQNLSSLLGFPVLKAFCSSQDNLDSLFHSTDFSFINVHG